MGRGSRARENDATRAERIRAMREKEAVLRANLDRLMKVTKDLADRAHYQKLGDEKAAAGKALADELVAADRKMRELLAECFGENLALELDCQGIEAETAPLQGKPGPYALDESLLQALPAEQASALRFTVALGRSRPPRPEAAVRETFDKAVAHLGQLRQFFQKAQAVGLEMAEIGREKARRGWVSTPEIEALEAGLHKHLETIEAGIRDYSAKLEEAAAGRHKTLARRRDLASTLSP